MAAIQQKDKVMVKEQENYAMQLENVFLHTAGELQEFINDKDFLLRAAHEQNLNQGNYDRSQTNEMRAETSKRAETVLTSVNETNEQSKLTVQNTKNDANYASKTVSSAEDNENEENYPRSTVQVINPDEHNDLRSKLKMKRKPLHYGDNNFPKPYYTGERWVPNRVISCFNCNGQHAISKCQLFDELRPAERREGVIQLKLCQNCFSPMVNKYGRRHICRSGMCRRCRKAFHNSKLCGK